MKKTYSIITILLLSLVAWGFTNPARADKNAATEMIKLDCQYKKGEVLNLSMKSVINRGTRCEAKIEGQITINSVTPKWADAKMVLTKLSAIKQGSGNGVSAGKDKLEDYELDVRLFPNGKAIFNSSDLEKLEKGNEDFLEDIALAQHFKRLFFPMPDKGFVLKNVTKLSLDNVLYQINVASSQDLITVTGKPITNKKNSTVKGSLELKYDKKTKKIVSLKQKHYLKTVREGFVNSESINEIVREITITSQK